MDFQEMLAFRDEQSIIKYELLMMFINLLIISLSEDNVDWNIEDVIEDIKKREYNEYALFTYLYHIRI